MESYEILGKHVHLIQERDFNTKQAIDTQLGAGYTVECLFCEFEFQFSNQSTLSSLMLLRVPSIAHVMEF